MQKLQDKIYVALQHEIQKKHSAEDKLSKVRRGAGGAEPGLGERSRGRGRGRVELVSHTWAGFGGDPGTC